MKQIGRIIAVVFLILSVPALGDEDAVTETKYFMAGVHSIAPDLHDALEDAAIFYIIKCGKVADVAVLKKIANSDIAFHKMLAILAMKPVKQNGEKSEPLDVSDMERYAAAAQEVSCLN